MRFIKLLFTAIFLFAVSIATAQSGITHLRKLSSPQFHGRGYYKKGDHKAAVYIRDEFRRLGLSPVNGSYFQDFSFPVNTFPGKMKVAAGQKTLIPGRDYIVSPACPSVKGTFQIQQLQSLQQTFDPSGIADDFLLVDKSAFPDSLQTVVDSILRNPPPFKGVVVLEPKKLTWSVATKVAGQVVIRVLKNNWPIASKTITLDIRNEFIEAYQTQNVMAMIPGSSNPDSFIVFTAHYDHLGRMGKKALFAGANDNASGTSMILDLAAYYMKPENRPGKSLLFIAFAAEEAGLIGSKYYTDHPPLPLGNIRFLLNLDLMGNGEDGMMVVNGELHTAEYDLLNSINDQQQLLKTIGKRGKARNSDHYWFSEKGVPAFFFYTTGGSTAYHDIDDVAANLPMTEFEDVKKLIIAFVNNTGK